MSSSEPRCQPPPACASAVFADAVAVAYELAVADRLTDARPDTPFGSAGPLPPRLRALLIAAMAIARDGPATGPLSLMVASMRVSLARWNDGAGIFYGGLLVSATVDLLTACHPATPPADADGALRHAYDYLNAIRVDALGETVRHR